MPSLNKYKSKDEEIKDHKDNYRSSGGAKGKFKADAPDCHRIQKIVEHTKEGDIVLDIGCNDGSLGVILMDRGCTVFGIDVVKELVEIAVQRGVFAKECNAENITHSDNKFDVVVMAEVMEHLFNPDDALKEIKRVLKPEGLFLGSVPHSKGYLGIGKIADYHNWVFTYEELESQLKRYFSDVKITETPYSERFCLENSIDKDLKQWFNWVCK